MPATIHIGCSGFSYDDWHGPFYPSDLPPAGRLGYYAAEFSCVELNTTFYRQPEPGMIASLANRTPEHFRFAVKVYGGITHDHRHATDADFERFWAGLEPLREQGKLGCLLAQFPNSFRPSKPAVAHLRRLREAWPEPGLVIEFRHAAWSDPRADALLERHRLATCVVDEPDLPGLMPARVQITASPAYVRFHGRNAARWYDHLEAWERYDYRYRADELQTWVDPIKELADGADDLYVFFNNHYEAQAVLNARELGQMLGIGPAGREETSDGQAER